MSTSLVQTETKIRDAITSFTKQKEEFFSSNLTHELKLLSAKLNKEQKSNLQGIHVANVVNDVTRKVIENVVAAGLAYRNPAIAPPLHLLTKKVAVQLVGNPMTEEQTTEYIDVQLNDLAAATYVSEIAQVIFDAIIPNFESQQHSIDATVTIDKHIKDLVSNAALAASPMGAIYAGGARLRGLTGVAIGIAVVGIGLIIAGGGFALVGGAIGLLSL